MGHKSIVIWFTDLSDFGQLTLAHSVEKDMGKTSVSDGDNVRHGLLSNLTFSNDAFNHWTVLYNRPHYK